MRTDRPFRARTLVVAGLLAISLSGRASAAEGEKEEPDEATAKSPAAPASPGPEINPYECYGRYQYATENRTVAQMEHELAQRLATLEEANQAATVRAIKLCVIARLKARLGESDAYDYFKQSIVADPVEPGLELWAAQYWSGNRGARRPIVEMAEKHYYEALRKLEAIQAAGRAKDYHAVVEDWVRRDLTVLYQMDGQPLLPWKAYRQGSGGRYAPGLSVSSQLRMAKDTRDFFFNSEYRQFTAETAFVNGLYRSGGAQPPFGQLTPRQKWDLVRAPIRIQVENKLRIRQNFIGTLDLLHAHLYQKSSQAYNYYDPTRFCTVNRICDPTLPVFSDIQVQQVGLGYERVIPLYPIFDLRIAGTAQKVWRDGIVEFHPFNVNHIGVTNRRETVNLYEFKPSISRFIGPDKLTINAVYALLDISPTPDAPPLERFRRKIIRAINFDYGYYRPMVLPTFTAGGLSTYRTATRGLYTYGGVMEDAEAWGTHNVISRDFYLGWRFEGPHDTDLVLQGTYGTTNTVYGRYDGRGSGVFSEPGQAFSQFRTTFVFQRRIRSYDTFPGMPPSHGGFASDFFTLVFPVFWDKGLTGAKDYENVRVGAQIWTKVIGTGLGGTTFLVTAGFDYQYYYNIQKALPMGQLAIRMGWGDL